jgi:hypothetical protein
MIIRSCTTTIRANNTVELTAHSAGLLEVRGAAACGPSAHRER